MKKLLLICLCLMASLVEIKAQIVQKNYVPAFEYSQNTPVVRTSEGVSILVNLDSMPVPTGNIYVYNVFIFVKDSIANPVMPYWIPYSEGCYGNDGTTVIYNKGKYMYKILKYTWYQNQWGNWKLQETVYNKVEFYVKYYGN